MTSRALGGLAAVDGDHPRLSLSEISRRAGLPVATTHRLVRELEEWRALRRGPDGCYQIGPRMWRLGLLSGVHSRARREGVARAAEERVLGACSIPVPVLDRGGVVAALAVVATAPRRDLDAVLPALRRAAAEVGGRLDHGTGQASR